jgi:tRNA guanosine-2'-O-methyltransferase
LARTCEIFGTENYVIESLKLTENSDFKALSKTAEKWLKISEVKPWQLFDYLLGMKQRGYSIVGAEQSGRSVSLVNVAIPQKAVLLLGLVST